jgi:hypothetical protein
MKNGQRGIYSDGYGEKVEKFYKEAKSGFLKNTI